MPNSDNYAGESYEDEHYLAMLAKPTNDEVGADIETYGHVPVTPENMTQDPFTEKGSLANALDELVESSEANVLPESLAQSQSVTHNPELSEVATGELTGELEGTNTDNDSKMVGEDKAVSVKDCLSAAFDEVFAMDDTSGGEVSEGDERAHEEWLKKERTPPKLPDELKDEDKPDEHGLVYITRTFKVAPSKYLSANYRPVGAPPLKQKQERNVGGDVVLKNEVTLEEKGSPDARWSAASADEPDELEENRAAKEADKFLKKSEGLANPIVKPDKKAEDAAPEKVVLDYATYIDGSSFCCFDELIGIDYSKITMDAGPRKKVTRENCQTTFAQCRAQNPLFCRFHGPRLLEADIKNSIGNLLGRGAIVRVTKDKDAKDPMTFRLTIGCAPVYKKNIEQLLDSWFQNAPGITPIGGKPRETNSGKMTQELEMDILNADRPIKIKDSKAGTARKFRDEAVAAGKTMKVVEETPEADMPKGWKGNVAPEAPAEQKPAEQVAQEPTPEETQETTPEPTPEQEVQQPQEEAQPIQAEQTEPKTEPIPPEERETVPEQGAGETSQEPVEQQPEQAETPEAAQIEEAEPMGVLEENEPPKESAEGKKQQAQNAQVAEMPKKKHYPYSFEAYGAEPNTDPETADLEPGGSGDYLGAKLLEYAANNNGLLRMPRNMGKYRSAIERWNRALKTGGKYHGKYPSKTNRPTFKQFNVEDPMADWIDSFLNGGTRDKDPGLFNLVFGWSPKTGGNDTLDGAADPVVSAFVEKEGMDKAVEQLIKAQKNFRKWVAKVKEANRKNRELKKRDAKEAKRRHFDKDDILSLDEIAMRDEADKEYNEAFAEVERYESNSPTIQNFSREQMKSLRDGDTIRFDHSKGNFIVKGYDTDNDILTVVGLEGDERYHVSPDGIERVDDFSDDDYLYDIDDDGQPSQTKQEEGGNTDETRREDGTAETGVGNEESETGRESEPSPEPETRTAEPEQTGEVEKPDVSEIDNAADAISTNADGLSPDAIKEGLESRLDGSEKISPDVMSLVDKSLPKGDPVRDALEQKAQSEDFSLESVSPEDLEREKKRNAERAEIKRRLEGDLHGSAGETGQSLFDLDGLEGEDLFNRVQAISDNVMKGNPTPEVRELAEEATEAIEDVRRNEAVASELDDFLSEMESELSGGDGAIVEAAIGDAIADADENAERATLKAQKGLKDLAKAAEESFRKTEKTAKGNAASKVESTLAELANIVFTENSKSDKIGDEAESIATSISDYAKEKGIDRELDSAVRDVIEDLKGDEGRLEGLMGEYQQAMDAEGTEFQEEDVNHILSLIKKLAAGIAQKFGLLRTMGTVEKRRIDDAVELKKEKERLAKGGALESDGESGGAEVETEAEAPEKPEAKREEEESPKSKAEKKGESEKPTVRDSGDVETRKKVVEASRRLGMDAYKPDEELQKMLDIAKRHLDNPRQAQRAKDLETVLSDRKVKGKTEVTEEEKRAARAERRFKDRVGSETLLPSEAFKGSTRDLSEGIGNQEVDEVEDFEFKEEKKGKKGKTTEDEMPERETPREIVTRLVLEALEG